MVSILIIINIIHAFIGNIEFTKVEQQRVWPPGRECHIACCLRLKTEHPQLLVSGGKNFRDIPLKFDLWMLDSTKFVWKKVSHIQS